MQTWTTHLLLVECPGPSFIVKPEVVHYGGNAGIDHQGALVQTGVRSFCIDGTLGESIGTSFSTPRVAALAAGLSKQMDQEFDPLLIKAMVIHSAKYPEKLAIPIEERLNQVGFGRPERVSDVIFNAPHEATLVLRDELVQGEKIDIMDFPMPDCLIADGYYFGQIVVTLVYSPILDPSQRAEYCQSNIDVKLGTYTKKEPRDTSKRHIRNPIGRAGSQNLLLDSLYSKKKLKQNQEGFAVKERLLIQYGDKFYPAKKYAIDLSELTEGNKRKHLTSSRLWYLSLQGLYRDHIEKKAEREGRTLRQEFCLLVTLRDPTGSRRVYDEVVQKLDQYSFWHDTVRTRSTVRVES